ncbi:MLP-like protein 28 [Hibiscus trionum]|uniref:MLP-like protein 28 n=1 Tax=Hibiscus trionum TaxID=183268 RepID=A0A9W7HCZ6_HIBTR|nr:MLP-like protein 28 [Hibiscus trionum]
MAWSTPTGKPTADVAKEHHTISSTEPSALSGKVEADVEIKASPEQFHDMFANKPHHMHHTCNDKVQGCDLHEGEWGKVGSIVEWSYVLDGKAKKTKEVIEAVDPDKNSITFRVIEGDLIVVHLTLEYEKLHQGIEHPHSMMQYMKDVSNGIDAHLTKPN